MMYDGTHPEPLSIRCIYDHTAPVPYLTYATYGCICAYDAQRCTDVLVPTLHVTVAKFIVGGKPGGRWTTCTDGRLILG